MSLHGKALQKDQAMKIMYTNGKFHPSDQNNISSMIQAFNYGTAAFEGMKAFYLKDRRTWFLFRPDQHYERISRSAAMLDIDLKMSLNQFVSVISALIRKNAVKTDIYIRPLVYRNQPGVGLTKPSGYGISIFIQSVPYSSANEYKCCVVSQRRPIDGSYSVKLTGNYVLSYFSQKEAVSRGYDVGILLSSNGYVSEASVMNLFFAENGKLFTPSLECGPLGGITRKSVIELAENELGISVKEGKFRSERLLEADEVFFTGTGSGVNFVRQIEKRKFDARRGNQIAREIARIFGEVTRGRIDRYSDWLLPV